MVTRTVHLLVVLVAALTLVSSCTAEEATVVDLDAVTTSTTADSSVEPSDATPPSTPFTGEVDPDDPNAEARQQVIDAARQQCLDDPELAEGVVRLVVADTGEVANEYRVDCVEVRAEEEG